MADYAGDSLARGLRAILDFGVDGFLQFHGYGRVAAHAKVPIGAIRQRCDCRLHGVENRADQRIGVWGGGPFGELKRVADATLLGRGVWIVLVDGSVKLIRIGVLVRRYRPY